MTDGKKRLGGGRRTSEKEHGQVSSVGLQGDGTGEAEENGFGDRPEKRRVGIRKGIQRKKKKIVQRVGGGGAGPGSLRLGEKGGVVAGFGK